MKKIETLAVDENVRIDLCRIDRITEGLGGAGDDLIGDALEQIALGVNRLRLAARDGHFATVEAEAARLSRLAEQLGLVSLAHVAADVSSCTRRRDGPALAATLARVRRVTNRSLAELGTPDGPHDRPA
ncbi:MAG: hypothetical protein Q4G36_04660 [Paracoccus sp. (in: a-proteobacteria)]|nr:hypothetical protein [Paracoccus sp. (in: a-proteobacteria)]